MQGTGYVMESRKTKFPYEVRWAKAAEWSSAMQMVWRTFLKFEGKVYTKEGIKNFFEFISDASLYEAFLEGRYQMMIALDAGKVIGVGTLRNRNHLSLLFVDENYQRMDVGRTIMNRLCTYLKEEEGERFMSLLSAPYAVNFYRKLGFRAVKPEEKISGIRVTAMEKVF